jgi:CIC family chloride channel protein
MLTTLVATGVSWAFLPDAPTYHIAEFHGSVSVAAWALVAGPIVGLVSVLYVRSIAWADHHKPKGWRRLLAPVVALAIVGAVSIPFPQILGNGRDVAELAFTGQLSPALLLVLTLLRPGRDRDVPGQRSARRSVHPVPGVRGTVRRRAWAAVVVALAGCAPRAVRSARFGCDAGGLDAGPISTVVLMMELTGYARATVVPLLLIVTIATLLARTIEPRSVYDARLSDAEVEQRQQQRARNHAA